MTYIARAKDKGLTSKVSRLPPILVKGKKSSLEYCSNKKLCDFCEFSREIKIDYVGNLIRETQKSTKYACYPLF